MKKLRHIPNNKKLKMNIKLKSILFLLLTFIVSKSNAQQDPQYTDYMFNPLTVNPAYAGSRGHLALTALHRTQWVGIDGAPQTQTLSIDSPIAKRLGLGISLVNDKIGPSDEVHFDANLSYTIRLTNESQLSFGMKGGGRLLNVDLSDGFQQTSDIPSINNKFLPTVGAGVYWHSETSYLGVAVPNFIASEYYDDNAAEIGLERLHYFLIGGKVFNLSPSIKVKPAFLTKFVVGAPVIVDLSANFLFEEVFRVGLAYRWDDSLSGLLGFQITQQLMLGYAYDLTTTELRNYNSGTHEIMLRFELKSKEKQLKSPRFF